MAIKKKKYSLSEVAALLVATIIITTLPFIITLNIATPAAATATTTPSKAAAATDNNNSNVVLGSSPFMIVKFKTASINPINQTYIETSTVNNVTIIPPNSTSAATINATEIANATINVLPNGLALDRGQSLIVTKGDGGGATEQEENATTAFVDISRMHPNGTGAGTGVVFFSTNSTGQLAFLNNMVGISQSEFSPQGGTIRTWEWKGGSVPLEAAGAASAPTENQTTPITSVPQE